MVARSLFLAWLGIIRIGASTELRSTGGAVAPLSPLLFSFLLSLSPQLAMITRKPFSQAVAVGFITSGQILWEVSNVDRTVRLPYSFVDNAVGIIPNREVTIILKLLKYLNTETRLCCPGIKTLAAECHTSPACISRDLHSLAHRGFLTIIRGKPNQYLFTELFYNCPTPRIDWWQGNRIVSYQSTNT